MQLVTVSIGFFLSGPTLITWQTVYTPLLLGSYLAASGAGALNQYIEIDIDRKMDRTSSRPLVTGTIQPIPALIFGMMLTTLGIGMHMMFVNELTALITSLTILIYLGVYTPLKRLSWLNTFVGAIPGALPILGGWTAVTGYLSPTAWILFVVMFTWQHPHFFALAISIADDYKKGGLQMLPLLKNGQNRTMRQIVLYTFLMILTATVPVFIGLLGNIYFFGMTTAGIGFFFLVLKLIRVPHKKEARHVFLGSIIYLQIWMFCIIFDKLL